MLSVKPCRALCRKCVADEVFYTACPTEGETSWITMHEDDHKEEILQSDDETVKKGIIDESSTLVNTIASLKAPPEKFGSKYRVTHTDEGEADCADKLSFAFAFYT